MSETCCTDAANEAPSAPRGDSSERRCRRCGTVAIADENRCKDCRSFLPGNRSSLVHGRRRRTLADPAESDLWQSWARDLGGERELTAGQRAVLARIVEADAICATAFTYLVGTKETLQSERVQKAISALATAASSVYRGASLLGLQRKAKRIPSLDEYLEAKQEAGS